MRGGNAKREVNIMAAHIPWDRATKMIQQNRERKADKRASIFREKSERPKSLKRGTNKSPSSSPSPDLGSY